MSTILERCDKWMEVNRGCFTQIQDALIKFATAERELQRQECAEAYRDTANDNQHSCFIQSVYESILAAGVEPTNPFGCGCWRLTNNMWTRNDTATIGCFVVMPSDAAFCDRCGAKRRKS